MEIRDINIETHIRNAQKLRSEALGEILGTAWNKCAQWFRRLAHRQQHATTAGARSSTSGTS